MMVELIKAMRPQQWTKTILFVFPAIIFDGKLFDPESLLRVSIACVLLILVSGSVYIFNDLVDLDKDRQHPTKKNRPIAAGKVSPRLALATAIILPILTIGFAIWFDIYLAIILVLYLILQLAYSFYLKHIPIIDILAITAGFVLRVAAGVVVIQVRTFSPWLYVCAGLLALLLIIGKRRQELLELGDKAVTVRPIFAHYNLELLNDMLRIVLTSTLITYIIYTIEAPTKQIANTNLALVTIPFVLYGLFRYLYLIYVKGMGSAPDELLLQDRGLQITILCWAVTFVFLIYVVPQLALP